MIECLCIDAKNRPEEVPMKKWISEGMKYHITHVYYHSMQGIQGCSLHEVRLKDCPPYNAFKLSRFAFTKKSLEDLKVMMKACSELNEIQISALLADCDLVTHEN
jgi:hypothetical protein